MIVLILLRLNIRLSGLPIFCYFLCFGRWRFRRPCPWYFSFLYLFDAIAHLPNSSRHQNPRTILILNCLKILRRYFVPAEIVLDSLEHRFCPVHFHVAIWLPISSWASEWFGWQMANQAQWHQITSFRFLHWYLFPQAICHYSIMVFPHPFASCLLLQDSLTFFLLDSSLRSCLNSSIVNFDLIFECLTVGFRCIEELFYLILLRLIRSGRCSCRGAFRLLGLETRLSLIRHYSYLSSALNMKRRLDSLLWSLHFFTFTILQPLLQKQLQQLWPQLLSAYASLLPSYASPFLPAAFSIIVQSRVFTAKWSWPILFLFVVA